MSNDGCDLDTATDAVKAPFFHRKERLWLVWPGVRQSLCFGRRAGFSFETTSLHFAGLLRTYMQWESCNCFFSGLLNVWREVCCKELFVGTFVDMTTRAPKWLQGTKWKSRNRVSCFTLQALKRARRAKHARVPSTMAHWAINANSRQCRLFATGHVMRSVHAPLIKYRLGYLTDQLWDMRTLCRKFKPIPVILRASFPFRSSASKVRAKWPIHARTLGHPCSTDAKSLASPQLVWTAWEPSIWQQDDRARNKALWTHYCDGPSVLVHMHQSRVTLALVTKKNMEGNFKFQSEGSPWVLEVSTLSEHM